MDHFRKRVTRKVDKDRTISLDGRLYEAPVAMIGRTVTLLYHESDPSGWSFFSTGPPAACSSLSTSASMRG